MTREKKLTKQQRLVLQSIARGRPLTAIDGIGYETARTHLKLAMKRLRTHTQAHAVAVAMRRGLIR